MKWQLIDLTAGKSVDVKYMLNENTGSSLIDEDTATFKKIQSILTCIHGYNTNGRNGTLLLCLTILNHLNLSDFVLSRKSSANAAIASCTSFYEFVSRLLDALGRGEFTDDNLILYLNIYIAQQKQDEQQHHHHHQQQVQPHKQSLSKKQKKLQSQQIQLLQPLLRSPLPSA
jgi:hypothetical protein